jgi:hypothetical protein
MDDSWLRLEVATGCFPLAPRVINSHCESRHAGTRQDGLFTFEGHGEDPEVLLGLNGVYLTDALTDGVIYQPYEGDESLAFDAGDVNAVTESPDGRFVALSAPRELAQVRHRPCLARRRIR